MNEKTIVIFGASGDLTRRKLIPALYRLFCQDKLTPNFCIVGAARRDWSRQQWCGDLLPGVQQFARDLFDADRWASFCKHLDFATVDIVDADAFARLAVRLDEMERGPRDRVYYLATLPRLYAQAAAHLGAAGLRDETTGARRLIVEKPFGVDRATAEQLNRDLHQVFDEHQVYRIDHYLGKETVQNLVVLRFANSIFEPIWNRNYIDHVQITVAESVDVGGRGGYYDSSGVLRDMFQNHLLQLMMITAMEAPVRFEATAVRDENVKVDRAEASGGEGGELSILSRAK